MSKYAIIDLIIVIFNVATCLVYGIAGLYHRDTYQMSCAVFFQLWALHFYREFKGDIKK